MYAKHTECQRPSVWWAFNRWGLLPSASQVKAGKKQGLSDGGPSQLTWAMGDAALAREVRERGRRAAVIRAASDSSIPWNGGKKTGSHRSPTSMKAGSAKAEKSVVADTQPGEGQEV